jgi:hypothetical protein
LGDRQIYVDKFIENAYRDAAVGRVAWAVLWGYTPLGCIEHGLGGLLRSAGNLVPARLRNQAPSECGSILMGLFILDS